MAMSVNEKIIVYACVTHLSIFVKVDVYLNWLT